MTNWAAKLILIAIASFTTLANAYESNHTEVFVVEVDGDYELAQLIAQKHEFHLDRKIEGLGNVYVFHRHPSGGSEELLALHPNVQRVEKQVGFKRAKRDGRNLQKRVLLEHEPTKRELAEAKPADKAIKFNDPLFKYEWYLDNVGQLYGSEKTREFRDINVAPAWLAGFSGSGVVTCVIDDAVQHDHSDLARNFNLKASINMVERESMYPEPAEWTEIDGHGTECAGIIAAVANNGKCGAGVAYNSSVGGIRLLGPNLVTDILEAEALTFMKDYCTSYSLSWGPADNGMIMEGPARYAAKALEIGTSTGRGGLGNLFVMAAGNGGEFHDHCGADGYVNNLHTISITSLNPRGETTYFDESCAAILAGVYIGGAENITDSPQRYFTNADALLQNDPQHAEQLLPGLYGASTTGIKNQCAVNFFGTSAAAPLALGCFALILEANAALSWRDVQHVVAHTARIPALGDGHNYPWQLNGAGLHFNSRTGFGALDCGRMVALAQQWQPVAVQHRCVALDKDFSVDFVAGQAAQIQLPQVDGCNGDPDRQVDKLEHVLLHLEIDYPQRGALTVVLVSPAGTRSELLGYRPNDHYSAGLNFEFKTVGNWDESPIGIWTVEVHADYPNAFVSQRRAEILDSLRNGTMQPASGTFRHARLVLYGTENSGPAITNDDAHIMSRAEILETIESEELLASSVKVKPINESKRHRHH